MKVSSKTFKEYLQENLDIINFLLKYTRHSKRRYKLLAKKKSYENLIK